MSWAAFIAYLAGFVAGVIVTLWIVWAVEQISAQVRRDMDNG